MTASYDEDQMVNDMLGALSDPRSVSPDPQLKKNTTQLARKLLQARRSRIGNTAPNLSTLANLGSDSPASINIGTPTTTHGTPTSSTGPHLGARVTPYNEYAPLTGSTTLPVSQSEPNGTFWMNSASSPNIKGMDKLSSKSSQKATPKSKSSKPVNIPPLTSTIPSDEVKVETHEHFRPRVTLTIYNNSPSVVQELRKVTFQRIPFQYLHLIPYNPSGVLAHAVKGQGKADEKKSRRLSNRGLRRDAYSTVNLTSVDLASNQTQFGNEWHWNFWFTTIKNLPTSMLKDSLVIRSQSDPYSAVVQYLWEHDDTSSFSSILQSQTGKSITLVVASKLQPDIEETFSGQLVTFDDANIILRASKTREIKYQSLDDTSDPMQDSRSLTIISLSDYSIKNIHLPEHNSFHQTPTLHVLIRTRKKFDNTVAHHNIELSYLLKGLSWKVKHNAILGPSDLGVDFSSRFSITNNSGKEFIAAIVHLAHDDEYEYDIEAMILAARRSSLSGMEPYRAHFRLPHRQADSGGSVVPTPSNPLSLSTVPSYTSQVPASGDPFALDWINSMGYNNSEIIKTLLNNPQLLITPGHHLAATPLDKPPPPSPAPSQGKLLNGSFSETVSPSSHNKATTPRTKKGFWGRGSKSSSQNKNLFSSAGGHLQRTELLDTLTGSSSWAYSVELYGVKFPLFLVKSPLTASMTILAKNGQFSSHSNQSLAPSSTVTESLVPKKGVLFPYEPISTTISNGNTDILVASTKVFSHVRKNYIFHSTPSSSDRFRGTLQLSENWGAQWNDIQRPVSSVVEFLNSTDNRLSSPLPTGEITLFRRMHEISRDNFSSKTPESQFKLLSLVKINSIYNHVHSCVNDKEKGIFNQTVPTSTGILRYTPINGLIQLHLGYLEGVYGTRTQRKPFIGPKRNIIKESFDVRLKNYTCNAVHVVVEETLSRWHSWVIIESDPPTYEQYEHDKIRFTTTVPALGERIISYTVRYSLNLKA